MPEIKVNRWNLTIQLSLVLIFDFIMSVNFVSVECYGLFYCTHVQLLQIPHQRKELESCLLINDFADKCVLDLSESVDQDVEILGNHMKAAFGSSWKKELCEKHLLEGKVDPGNPAILIISTSALRSIELLRWSYVSFISDRTTIGISCKYDIAGP